MVIKIDSKKKEAPMLRRLHFFLILSIVFLLSVSAVYLLVIFSIRRVEEKISQLEKALVETEEERLLEERVLLYEWKIDEFDSLLQRHKSPTRFFELLEKLSHPKVYFTRLELDTEEAVVDLEGRAEDFQILSQQQEIFQQNQYLTKVSLLKASLAEQGRVEFIFHILLEPDFF